MVFAVLLMALPVASYILMFKPRDAEIKLAEADIRARRDKLAALKQATSEVKDLPEEIEKLRKAIAFFEGKLPEEKEMDKVLGEVWQIAEKNGLNTKSVRTMKAIPGDNYSEQPIRMVIVASRVSMS
jgi:Tfp pilus assembly protein PilO